MSFGLGNLWGFSDDDIHKLNQYVSAYSSLEVFVGSDINPKLFGRGFELVADTFRASAKIILVPC